MLNLKGKVRKTKAEVQVEKKHTFESIRMNEIKKLRKVPSWAVAKPKNCFQKDQFLCGWNNMRDVVWNWKILLIKHGPIFYILEVLNVKNLL